MRQARHAAGPACGRPGMQRAWHAAGMACGGNWRRRPVAQLTPADAQDTVAHMSAGQQISYDIVNYDCHVR